MWGDLISIPSVMFVSIIQGQLWGSANVQKSHWTVEGCNTVHVIIWKDECSHGSWESFMQVTYSLQKGLLCLTTGASLLRIPNCCPAHV